MCSDDYYCGYADGKRDGIKQARTMTPESEPPNTHRPVLCFDGYNYFKGNYDGTWNSEYGSHLGITHWMELPEVPG